MKLRHLIRKTLINSRKIYYVLINKPRIMKLNPSKNYFKLYTNNNFFIPESFSRIKYSKFDSIEELTKLIIKLKS